MRKEIVSLKLKINQLNISINSFQEEIERNLVNSDDLEQKISLEKKMSKKSVNEIELLDATIQKLKSKEKNLIEEKEDIIERYNSIEKKLKTINSQKISLEMQNNILIDKIDELVAKIDELEKINKKLMDLSHH